MKSDLTKLPRARTGKIARCAAAIREEVNLRLRDGWSGPQIIAWLNRQPKIIKLINRDFGSFPVNLENLSNWRRGGYQDFLDTGKRNDLTATIQAFANDIKKILKMLGYLTAKKSQLRRPKKWRVK